MPIRLLAPDTEKRKAKRGQTGGGRTSSWKRPYKDYTKYKHSDLIKTSTGKTGKIVEKGSPGQEGRTHTKAMKRLNELQKLKSREGTRMTSGAQRKRKEHLQSGGYKAGGRIGLKEGGGGTYGGWPKGGPSKPRPRPLPSPGRPDKPKKWELPKWDRPPRKIPKHLRDRLKDLTKKGRPSPGRPGGKGKEAPDKRWNKGDKFMTPLRAKHGIGSLVKGAKKIITKLKPKGVFKPKPKVDDIDKPFKGYDKSYTRADDKKMDALLKKLGDEIKAQPLPPKLKETMKKLQKAYGPHKKASGGRIGLKKGSVHKPGSHSWWLLQQSKPRRSKKASGGRIGLKDGGSPHTIDRQRPPRKKYIQSGKGGGWIPKSEGIKRPKYKSGGRIGLKHGGSVGAAIRGHGAEIK